MSESTGIGTKVINQLAEASVRSQFDDVDELSVEVETSPQALAGGEVSSITIDGTGIDQANQVRTDELHIETGSITVNPWKAAIGSIELKDTVEAIATMTFTISDINKALNSDGFRHGFASACSAVRESTVPVNLQSAQVEHQDDGICVRATLSEAGQEREMSLHTQPVVASDGRSLAFRPVQQPSDGVDAIAACFIQQLEDLFDVRHLALDSSIVTIQEVKLAPDGLIVHSDVQIQELP